MHLNPTLSIIIPVYNADPYLKQCLDSILNQTFRDYEVIAINDGSTDNSLEILNAYAATHSEIHIIDQRNSGVSKARNVGIATAQGKFITFIDADDIIRPNYLSHFQYDDTYGWQIQGYELNYISNESKNKSVCPKRTAPCSLKSAFEEAELTKTSRGPYLKLFLNSVIQKYAIRFDERLSYGEDAIFVKEYLLHCGPIAYCIAQSDYIYNHYPVSTSLVHRYHDPRLRYLATSKDYDLFFKLQAKLGTFSQDAVFDFIRERALEMYDELKKALFDFHISKAEKIVFFEQVRTGLFVKLQSFNKLPITYRVMHFFIKHFNTATCVAMLARLLPKE